MTAGEPTIYYGTLNSTTPVLNARGIAPALAVNGGEIHLVWEERNGTTNQGEVFYLRGDGVNWSFAENLSASPAVASRMPDIALGLDGTVYVVWNEGGTIVLRSGRSLQFAPALDLSGPTNAGVVRIAADAADNLAVAWEEAGERVRLVGRPSGGAWPPPQAVTEGEAGLEGVDLAFGSAGEVHVAWSAVPGAGQAGDVFLTRVSLFAPPQRLFLPLVMRDG